MSWLDNQRRTLKPLDVSDLAGRREMSDVADDKSMVGSANT